MNTVREFTGKYRFLSNFFPSPITLDGVQWPTAEHLFQAMKTRDLEMREKIRQASTPGDAKSLGGQAKLRAAWDIIRHRTMRVILKAKFEQNPELAQKLINTGNMELEEGNYWHDNYWGICKCHRICKNKKGQNHLGLLLMELREELSE